MKSIDSKASRRRFKAETNQALATERCGVFFLFHPLKNTKISFLHFTRFIRQ